MQHCLDRARANDFQCYFATFSPKSRGGENEGRVWTDVGPGAGGRAKEAQPVCGDSIFSYSLQVASIGAPGAQALGEALSVNRTLEILE